MLHLEEIIKTLGLEELPTEEQAELLTSIEEATLEIALDELTAELSPEKVAELNSHIEASETLSEATEAIVSLYPHFSELYDSAVKVFMSELVNSFNEEKNN